MRQVKVGISPPSHNITLCTDLRKMCQSKYIITNVFIKIFVLIHTNQQLQPVGL